MSRPTLTICTSCKRGEQLYDRVRKLRKQRELKEAFRVDGTDCLGCCDAPIAIELRGKKRSTYTRICLSDDDADAVLALALAYEELTPGAEIPERALPGESGD